MSSLRQNFALRPLEIKHIFDFAIRLLRSGFQPMFLATAMVQLPLALLTMPLLLQLMQLAYEISAMGNESNAEFMTASFWSDRLDLAVFAFVMLFVALAYQVLITPLGNLICARLAACRLLAIPCSFADAWAFARQRYWATQVAIAVFLLPLLVLSAVMLLIVLGAQAAGDDMGILVAAGFGIFVISLGSFATQVYFCIYFPAINGIIQASEDPEGNGILAQGLWYLRRAGTLTRGHFWRMLGMLLLLSFIVDQLTRGVSEVVNMITAIIGSLVTGSGDEILNRIMGTPESWEIGVVLVVAHLFALIFPPYWQCYKTLLYYDLRCRREAFDLKRQLGLEEGALAGETAPQAT